MTKMKAGDGHTYTLKVYYHVTTKDKIIYLDEEKLNKDIREFLIKWYKTNVDPDYKPYITELRETSN